MHLLPHPKGHQIQALAGSPRDCMSLLRALPLNSLQHTQERRSPQPEGDGPFQPATTSTTGHAGRISFQNSPSHSHQGLYKQLPAIYLSRAQRQTEGSTGHRTQRPSSTDLFPFHWEGRALPAARLLRDSQGCSGEEQCPCKGHRLSQDTQQSDLVTPQDCQLQKGLVLSKGGKASTPWTFQDGPDYHHLCLF